MQRGLHRTIYRSRSLLIIYSIICTLWLIIRTGRRPSRIVYPCQRAAASQSLWLWSFLVGSSPSFIPQLFNRKLCLPHLKDYMTEFYEFKRLFLAVALMTGVFMFAFGQPGLIPSLSILLQTQSHRSLPITNFSVAMGNSADSKSIVTIIGSDNPSLSQPIALNQILNYSQVKDMVWSALDADTSSKSLRDVINDNNWVVIKPNIVTAPLQTIDGTPVTYYWYQGIPHKGQNTDLRVVKAVIEYLVQHKNLRRITIAEGSAEWAKLDEPGTDPDMDMDGWIVHWQEYDNLSYEQIRDEINAIHPGLVDLVDLSYDGYRYVEVPDPFQSGIGGLQRSGYYMPNTVLDCDKWIDVAVMKTHSIPGISLAMKLRIGTLANQAYGPPQEGYMELHSHGAQGVKQAIIDMYSYRPADYAIVEGIWSTEGDGPQWGNDLARNVIVAGHDAVAVDAIGATIAGFNPWDLDYLHLAALKKLGTFTLQHIKVIGDSINHVAIDFAKPIMWPENVPYVGRGNRNWLVNGVYSSTNLNVDFLGNESTIQPVEGMTSAGHAWQLSECLTDMIDMKEIFGSQADHCIVYAFVYVNSSQNIATNLWIGVDDGIKVWVNGQVVFSESQAGGYIFPEHKIPILLNQGSNTILCKILNYSQDFEFRMNISDDDGDTPLEVEYMTNPPNAAPSSPQLLSPLDDEVITSKTPLLSWTIPSDVDRDSLHFLVHICPDSNFASNLQIYDSQQNSSGFSPTPPVPEGSGTMSLGIQSELSQNHYWWRVAAWDGNSYSDFSASFHFIVDTTANNIAPQKPLLLSPFNGQFVNNAYPQLTWAVPVDSNGDALHFQLQLSKSINFVSDVQSYFSEVNTANFSPSPPYPQGTGTVNFTFSEPLFEISYWWRASAHDGLVDGPFSNPFQFLIDITPPDIQFISMTEPSCLPDWYNQNLCSTITAELHYQEHHASHARLSCTNFPLTIVKHSIPSGNSCLVDFVIEINHISDGRYLFNASILDSAENATVDTFSIRLDSTPPSGTTAFSPDTSQSLSFVIDWSNTGSDSGSGLSGLYDIQVKIDNSAYQIWKTRYEGTKCEFTEGEHGHRYSFEVAAWDRVGNREPFLDAAESTTLVDTSASSIYDYRMVSQVPDNFYLKQNYPNPFNNSTCIEFGLPAAGRVKLTIYNLMGHTIKTILSDEMKSPGTYRFNWDGTDHAGHHVVSGLYVYKIEVNDFCDIKKLMFLK